jgi:hypothetical protein
MRTDTRICSCGASDPERPASDFKPGAEKRAGEAGAPGNTEFPVELVQVVVNSGRAEEQPTVSTTTSGRLPVLSP